MRTETWIGIWFIFGLAFFALSICRAFEGNFAECAAFIAMSNACHARCEVKALQRRMEETENDGL